MGSSDKSLYYGDQKFLGATTISADAITRAEQSYTVVANFFRGLVRRLQFWPRSAATPFGSCM